jgi:MFS family permease
MKSHALLVIAVVLSAITCGATFLFALYRQLALVEVAASLAVGVELYLLSSSIGDWIEQKPQANRRRLLIAGSLAAAVVLSFLISRSLAK